MYKMYDRRHFGALAASGLGILTGCAAPDPLDRDLPDMGDFQLRLPITVADDALKIPPSRDADPADWKAVMNAELSRRFGAYRGGRDYYIAVNIDGYALAPPGIPIVFTPQSLLVVTANLWTAEPQRKVLGPEQITTFEGADTLLIGSGLVKDSDAQMRTLARNMARKIQSWILRSPDLLMSTGPTGLANIDPPR